MSYQMLPIEKLLVNPANDRHGELASEDAAIALLLNTEEKNMRNLAKDLVQKGKIFEPPLVFLKDNFFVVADGNRRTTCLKLLRSPDRAPTPELQDFFADIRKQWLGVFPDNIECRIENDLEVVDDILYRRHTGVQGGVGQSNWNDRMKNNFVQRTGRSSALNVADEVEKILQSSGNLPIAKIPRANLNRLLSSEAIRNRVGISVVKGKMQVVRDRVQTLGILARIADDLSQRRVTLDDLWDNKTKSAYLDKLESEGLTPNLTKTETEENLPHLKPVRGTVSPAINSIDRLNSNRLFQTDTPTCLSKTELQRHRQIWEELRHKLTLNEHPNAVAVLIRVLLELAVEYYVIKAKPTSVHKNDSLSVKVLKVAQDMKSSAVIDSKYLSEIKKLQRGEEIISINTLNSYVHSQNFNASPSHLRALWATLSTLIIACLNN